MGLGLWRGDRGAGGTDCFYLSLSPTFVTRLLHLESRFDAPVEESINPIFGQSKFCFHPTHSCASYGLHRTELYTKNGRFDNCRAQLNV